MMIGVVLFISMSLPSILSHPFLRQTSLLIESWAVVYA